MKSINFDDGSVTLAINGAATITFNPTDRLFISKVLKAFETLGGIQSDRQALDAQNEDDLYATVEAQNSTMRETIDSLFDEPICDAVFGKKDLGAFSGGVPLWCKLMLALIDEITGGMESTKAEVTPALSAYLEKYPSRG